MLLDFRITTTTQTKKILSTNTKAPINVEMLMEEIDFAS